MHTVFRVGRLVCEYLEKTDRGTAAGPPGDIRTRRRTGRRRMLSARVTFSPSRYHGARRMADRSVSVVMTVMIGCAGGRAGQRRRRRRRHGFVTLTTRSHDGTFLFEVPPTGQVRTFPLDGKI